MKLMLDGQEALFREDFDLAEASTRKGISQLPEHPLPRVFLDSVVLTRIQDGLKPGKATPAQLALFFREADLAIAKASAAGGDIPPALRQYYLGGALGMRGLGHLYAGHYMAAYRDGRKARKALEKAVALDPGLFNAYLGLGEFEYQSAHLGHVVQFILGMPGSKVKGIAMLKTCAAKATYASVPARVFLARILVMDEKDYPAGLPYVAELVRRYPGNRRFARYGFAEAAGLGLKNPEARALLKSLSRSPRAEIARQAASLLEK
jgi:tetratricopeptide (TPR) repeat protein